MPAPRPLNHPSHRGNLALLPSFPVSPNLPKALRRGILPFWFFFPVNNKLPSDRPARNSCFFTLFSRKYKASWCYLTGESNLLVNFPRKYDVTTGQFCGKFFLFFLFFSESPKLPRATPTWKSCLFALFPRKPKASPGHSYREILHFFFFPESPKLPSAPPTGNSYFFAPFPRKPKTS